MTTHYFDYAISEHLAREWPSFASKRGLQTVRDRRWAQKAEDASGLPCGELKHKTATVSVHCFFLDERSTMAYPDRTSGYYLRLAYGKSDSAFALAVSDILSEQGAVLVGVYPEDKRQGRGTE